MPTNKSGVSFRLSDESKEILSRLSKEQNASQTQIVETALKVYARAWASVNRCLEDEVKDVSVRTEN